MDEARDDVALQDKAKFLTANALTLRSAPALPRQFPKEELAGIEFWYDLRPLWRRTHIPCQWQEDAELAAVPEQDRHRGVLSDRAVCVCQLQV